MSIVDRLNVNDISQPLPTEQVQRFVVHPKCSGAWWISTVSIGHQNDILVHDRSDGRFQRISIDRSKNCAGCRAAAVSGNQYRNLFIRQSSFAGLAASAARLAPTVSFAFLAFQNIGLVGLDNACELAWLLMFRGENSVPPTECGVDGKSAPLC